MVTPESVLFNMLRRDTVVMQIFESVPEKCPGREFKPSGAGDHLASRGPGGAEE
jgi:hypothetical protein